MTVEVKRNIRHFLFIYLFIYLFINLEGKSERIMVLDVCETAWVVL